MCDAVTPTDIYTLSLHDALPISGRVGWVGSDEHQIGRGSLNRTQDGREVGRGLRIGLVVDDLEAVTLDHGARALRSEEHTSELQSQFHLVCRLLLEKKNTLYYTI